MRNATIRAGIHAYQAGASYFDNPFHGSRCLRARHAWWMGFIRAERALA